ncbi:hypothetical protein Tco_0974466 [Tanacetum coccineum]|uniref:Ubiquitin-like protease family profile domain-containing protein n=1 Tax=Tanacetum coccineum TaxID=301880 RepID=A0ABQ5EBP9_9ASTR
MWLVMSCWDGGFVERRWLEMFFLVVRLVVMVVYVVDAWIVVDDDGGRLVDGGGLVDGGQCHLNAREVNIKKQQSSDQSELQKDNATECGVFLMMHMEIYNGVIAKNGV